MSYTQLHLPSVQQEIKHLCQGQSGVYQITKRQNGKSSLGSAISKSPKSNRLYLRFRNHFFQAFQPLPLQRAIRKYGIEAFSWEILEWTLPLDTRGRENHYLQTLKPAYTILPQAESSLGYRHTQETRALMKKMLSAERRQQRGDLNRNKKLSPEVREKLSHAAGQRTPEQKKRHQEACERKNRQLFAKATRVLDAESKKVLGTSARLRQACEAWGGNSRSLKRAVKSGKVLTKCKIYVE